MSSNYLYKGVNIISQITQHETGAEDISGYSDFPHTVTNYTSQRPLDFGYYSNSGNEKSAINEQCSALRNKFVNSANEIQIPDNCKGVRVLLIGGHGGTGGTGGSATASSDWNSATGNGGDGGKGGFGTYSSNNHNLLDDDDLKHFNVTTGERGQNGNNGNKEKGWNQTVNGNNGNNGLQGGSSSIYLYNDNDKNSILLDIKVSGGTGGDGGKGGKANSNRNTTNSHKGESGDSNDPTNTSFSQIDGWPDISTNTETGVVQIVWLYD